MTGEIINNGMNNFEPIVDKLGDITTEFIPYLIGIAITILGVSLTIRVVKYIINYMKQQSINTRREKRARRDAYYTRKAREKYRRDLIEYAKHGYNVKDEREAMGFGRYHG